MTQAIVTRFLPPTNTKGARVKATAKGGSVTLAWDHERDEYGNHTRAVFALVHRLEWNRRQRYASGVLPNGDMVWCAR